MAIEMYDGQLPPAILAGGDTNAQQGPLTTGAASSAAIELLGVPTPMGEAIFTFVVTGNPVHLNFGGSGVGAATANSAILPVGLHRLTITAGMRYFRHLQNTGAGRIDVWKSS